MMGRYSEFAWDRWHNPCFWCGDDLWTDSQDVKAICRACDRHLEKLREEHPPRDFTPDDDSQTTFHYHGVT
ncbi:hypothetical protein AUR64_17405 [Haloprofundus marisrubri]|uniref:Uncharacterized protein n=1 Tax=Haloprofundus marisrubri TaxID=1514971 RepID=A0A0W1R5E5_9EURY|nr:hypothetical protein AUR64_17405 [Haloprofundus marisrubri]